MYAVISSFNYAESPVTYEMFDSKVNKVVLYADYNKAIKKVREMKKKDRKNKYIIRKI